MNCICKSGYKPRHCEYNGGYYRGEYTTKQGDSFTFTFKTAISYGTGTEYTLTSNDGYKFDLDRQEFMKHFTIKSHMRNRKLEQLGIL